MTDEEILLAVQNKPDKVGEYEREGTRKAAILAACICVALCVLMICLDMWIEKNIDFGKPAILLTFSGILRVFEGKTSCKKRMLIGGIIEIILAVMCVILYLGALFI